MHHKPDPNIHGSVMNFFRSLFQALLQNGYSHPEILRMSLREALLVMFGSPDAVDDYLGDGTYRGVQETYGDIVPWRMAWWRVRREQEAVYIAWKIGCETLSDASQFLRDAKMTDREIVMMVEQQLH